MNARKPSRLNLLSKLISKNRGLVCGFFMAAGLMLVGCVDSQSAETKESNLYQISGIYLGMSETDVVSKLGEPQLREETPEFTAYIYEGLIVSFRDSGLQLNSPRVVSDISAESSQYCLLGDVCPGDMLDSISTALGVPDEVQPAIGNQSKRLYYPMLDVQSCWLRINTNDNLTASSINIDCLP